MRGSQSEEEKGCGFRNLMTHQIAAILTSILSMHIIQLPKPSIFLFQTALNAFLQAVQMIQFCYELMKMHHWPASDLALPSVPFKLQVQAAPVILLRMRHSSSGPPSIKVDARPPTR